MVFAALQVGSLLAWQNWGHGGNGEGGGACFLFFGCVKSASVIGFKDSIKCRR